jgi:hypothetical protein
MRPHIIRTNDGKNFCITAVLRAIQLHRAAAAIALTDVVCPVCRVAGLFPSGGCRRRAGATVERRGTGRHGGAGDGRTAARRRVPRVRVENSRIGAARHELDLGTNS